MCDESEVREAAYEYLRDIGYPKKCFGAPKNDWPLTVFGQFEFLNRPWQELPGTVCEEWCAVYLLAGVMGLSDVKGASWHPDNDETKEDPKSDDEAKPEDQWTDEEKEERARRFVNLRCDNDPFKDTCDWHKGDFFAGALQHVEKSGEIGDPVYFALKRCCGIHEGLFIDEPYLEKGYFDDDTPDYPSQWTDPHEEGGGGLSDESAQWLYEFLDEHGLNSGFSEKIHDLPTDLPKGLREIKKGGNGSFWFKINNYIFKTGGLELPNCVDEKELHA